MHTRPEERPDREAIYAVNVAAFGTPAEAELVNALREQARSVVSLVAVEDNLLVGHILFSPVALAGHPDPRIMGLGPMAVAPARQRQGVGTALVRAGLQQCRLLGFGAVVVLGHPDYYPRFGFSPAVRFGIDCEYEAPEEAFMAIELQPGFLSGVAGTIRYHAAFNDV